MILLLQPSVKPLVTGVKNEFNIPFSQLSIVFAHFSKCAIPLSSADSIYSDILFLDSSLSLQSSILRKSSLNQCAIFRFADLYNIIFTCCFCSSFNSSNRFNKSFLECLKYFLSLFGNFFCSSFRTLSNAHIIYLIHYLCCIF